MTEPALKLPTPSTSHITSQPVYPPSEDSYLLLDAFSQASEVSFLASLFPLTSPSPLLVEIGTGSGVVSAFLAGHASKIFSRRDVISLGIDVSFTANCVTNKTVDRAISEYSSTAAVFCGSVTSDLATALKPKCVDVLVFNPPYVPTSDMPTLEKLRTEDGRKVLVNSKTAEEFVMEEYLLSLTYAGGKSGMETTNRLIEALDNVLSDRGVLYLLLCAGNKPDEVQKMVKSLGWSMNKVIERRAGWERLSIWRICRAAYA